PTWSVSGGGSINSTGLFTATTPGGPYSVSASASGLNATGFVWVLVSATNHPPIPASPTLQRYASQGVKSRVTALLGTDPDGDGLFLAAVASMSANGATVSTNQGWVYYVPPPGFTNA